MSNFSYFIVYRPLDVGRYCPTAGMKEIDENLVCDDGSYCEESSRDATGRSCPSGHRCTSDTTFPVPCNRESYQKDTSKDSCDDCPVGESCLVDADFGQCDPENNPTQCDDSILSSGVESPGNCPEGFYCPEASQPEPCPAGTFNDQQRKEDARDCLPCKEGHFCATKGNVAETGDGLCADGFECKTGSTRNDEEDDICKQGRLKNNRNFRKNWLCYSQL